MLDDFNDCANNDYVDYPSDLEDGDTAELKLIPGGTDRETGYMDSWTYEFVKAGD